MERAKRIAPNNGEILLPESIIQNIQCRLDRKEAAQTTILSKYWYRAWSTRPDINLDFGHVQRGDEDPNILFPEYARRTMGRYAELNLKINTFRLCMEGVEHDDGLLARELIDKAMQLGAEDIDVEFISHDIDNGFISEDFDDGFISQEAGFESILSQEILRSENLVRLSMSGCRFEIGEDVKINWPNLKFLGLRRVYVGGDDLLNIMIRCPLVEKLELSDCTCMSEALFVRYWFGEQKIVNNGFNHLKHLMLSQVKITPWFLHDFSSKFPCMKELTLSHCLGPQRIHIYSHSLESINIDQKIVLRARIDVSSLRIFSLSSRHLPYLTFGTVARKWDSLVSVRCSNYLNNKWFRNFKKFLTVMSPSKLYLSLNLTPSREDNLNLGVGINCVPVLEDLTVNVSALRNHLFWDGLFWSCRPKLITMCCSSSIHDIGALEDACRRLINADGDCYSANKMLGQSDPAEVNVEVFDETVAEWKHVSWKTLLDASTGTETKRKICFHLRWEK